MSPKKNQKKAHTNNKWNKKCLYKYTLSTTTHTNTETFTLSSQGRERESQSSRQLPVIVNSVVELASPA